MTPAEAVAAARRRVEGDREQEIRDAVLQVLGEVGYDRLTMDAIAARSKASKATLYRRWTTKATLVVDALTSVKAPSEKPDTGSLRGDLMAAFCGHGGLDDHGTTAQFAAIMTAINTDAEFATEFRTRVLAPKAAVTRELFERAQARGELRDDVDLDIVVPALAGIVLHRVFMLGERADEDVIERAIDQVILPAVRPPGSTSGPSLGSSQSSSQG